MQVEGQRVGSLLSMPATGGRVRNAYPTFPLYWISPPKGGLMPDVAILSHGEIAKPMGIGDGDASH